MRGYSGNLSCGSYHLDALGSEGPSTSHQMALPVSLPWMVRDELQSAYDSHSMHYNDDSDDVEEERSDTCEIGPRSVP
jgi:hypothetical protein